MANQVMPESSEMGPRTSTTSDIRPRFVRLSEVQAKPINWLWANRFPLGMLSLMVGIEGSGKTFAALDIGCRTLPPAAKWPDSIIASAPEIGSVVFLTSEDNLEYTVKLRLDAMGADTSRVAAMQGVTTPEGDFFFDVTKHAAALEDLMRDLGDVRLIIVDLSPRSWGDGSAQQRRGANGAGPLRYDCRNTWMCSGRNEPPHKDASKAAIHRTLGSVAFSAAARAVWLVQKDQDDEARRLFVPVKMNIAPLASSLAFRIEGQAVAWESGQFAYKADDVLADHRGETPIDEATEFLRQIFAPTAELAANEIKVMARREGIAEATLKRAKTKGDMVAENDPWAPEASGTGGCHETSVFDPETKVLTGPLSVLVILFEGAHISQRGSSLYEGDHMCVSRGQVSALVPIGGGK